MKKSLFFLGLSLAAISPAAAQTGIRPPQGWSLGLLGGAAAFSDMQRGTIRVVRPVGTGVDERDLARRVGAETASSLGGYLAFWPSRNWGLRLHASYSPSRFETLMNEGDAEYAGMTQTNGGERLAGLSIISTDLQALFRLPTVKDRVMLYGILGGGVARYSVNEGDEPVPPEAEGDFENGVKVRPAAVIGLGAMLPFRNRAFRMHFELTNHVGATPLAGGHRQFRTGEQGIVVIDPRDEPSGERRVTVTNTVRFMVGVSFAARK